MTTPEQIKSCCAAAYGQDAVALVLGESTVQRARTAIGEAGRSEKVRFHLGDAERLPLPDSTFDALVCECAFCTFPDKVTAAAEFARVLRPGGRVGITDVTVAEARLPAELTTVAAWVACIADARPLGGYSKILADAGLRTVRTEAHDDAIAKMIDQIEARLGVLRMTAADRLTEAGVDVDAMLHYTALVDERLRPLPGVAESGAPDGRSVTTGVLGPGTVFGEMDLLGLRMRATWAEALEATELCLMSRTDVRELLFTDPRIVLRIAEQLSTRLADLEQRLTDLTSKALIERLAVTLCQLARHAPAEPIRHG